MKPILNDGTVHVFYAFIHAIFRYDTVEVKTRLKDTSAELKKAESSRRSRLRPAIDLKPACPCYCLS